MLLQSSKRAGVTGGRGSGCPRICCQLLTLLLPLTLTLYNCKCLITALLSARCPGVSLQVCLTMLPLWTLSLRCQLTRTS